MNEAAIDALANRILGYRSFQYDSQYPVNDLAFLALDGDRKALRKLVKDAIREARDEISEAAR